MPSTKAPPIKPEPIRVLIVVRGGIATVTAATGDVEAFIVDHDGEQIGEGVSVHEDYPKQCTPPQFARILIAETK